MTLTTAKLAHIDALMRRSWQGRSQLVDLTLRNPDGTTRVKTVTALWDPVQDADPSLGPAYGEGAAAFSDVDVQAVFSVADLSLAELRSCVHAALHPGEGQGVQVASTYTLTTVSVHGIRPGGSRFFTQWIRQAP